MITIGNRLRNRLCNCNLVKNKYTYLILESGKINFGIFSVPSNPVFPEREIFFQERFFVKFFFVMKNCFTLKNFGSLIYAYFGIILI